MLEATLCFRRSSSLSWALLALPLLTEWGDPHIVPFWVQWRALQSLWLGFRSEELLNRLFMPMGLCACTWMVQVGFVGKGPRDRIGSNFMLLILPGTQMGVYLLILPVPCTCLPHLLLWPSGSSVFLVLFHVILKSLESYLVSLLSSLQSCLPCVYFLNLWYICA